jgi:hypothetical protein
VPDGRQDHLETADAGEGLPQSLHARAAPAGDLLDPNVHPSAADVVAKRHVVLKQRLGHVRVLELLGDDHRL